jgi:hypothetical protein
MKRQVRGLRDRKLLRWLVLIAAVVAALPVLMASTHFRRDRIIEGLQGGTKCDVSVSSFRRLLFPRPGAELTGVRFSRGAPLAETARLRIESSWLYLLTFQKRLVSVDADALRLTLPDSVPPPRPHKANSKKTLVENLTAHGAVLSILGGEFKVSWLHLTDVNGDGPTGIHTTMEPPHPKKATLEVQGEAGPFRQPKAQIATKGTFRLTGVQLAEYDGLAGTLDGEGYFEGPLVAVRVTGEAFASQFEVNHSGHPLDLRADYDALVNGETGQVKLQQVNSSFLRTNLAARGTVDRKLTALDFDSQSARIEDLLTMFTRSDTPALRAPIQLRAHVELPSGQEPFLERLYLDGNFRMTDAVWSRTRMQTHVNALSARARGNSDQAESGEGEHVFSDLSASVTLRNGTATLKDVTFRIPGAVATGGGAYGLQSKRVNLQGVVRMESNASEATSGWKSALLKPLNFIFRKKDQGKRGATLPVSIVGSYPRPQFRAGLTR